MGRFIAATMRWISFLLVLSPALVFGATYEETRDVVDSAGKKFKCTYKLNYNAKNVFNKAKSTATCTPKKNGKVVEETFDIKEIGKSVTVKHTIKKGKKTITSINIKDYVAPTTTAAPAPASDMTHDCTCKMSPDSEGNFMTAVRSAVPAVVNRQLFGGGPLSKSYWGGCTCSCPCSWWAGPWLLAGWRSSRREQLSGNKPCHAGCSTTG